MFHVDNGLETSSEEQAIGEIIGKSNKINTNKLQLPASAQFFHNRFNFKNKRILNHWIMIFIYFYLLNYWILKFSQFYKQSKINKKYKAPIGAHSKFSCRNEASNLSLVIFGIFGGKSLVDIHNPTNCRLAKIKKNLMWWILKIIYVSGEIRDTTYAISRIKPAKYIAYLMFRIKMLQMEKF